MATTKNLRSRSTRAAAKVGLLAFGSSGPWDLAIDEALSGPDRWFAQFESNSVSLYFEIPSPTVVGRILKFFDLPRHGRNAHSNGINGRADVMRIGADHGTPVFLIRDNEYNDRFFVVIGRRDNPVARIMIKGSDVVNIARALRQIKDELEETD